MAKNKFYVVWEGREPGVYTSWDETEAQVKGHPGAQFKGFPSMELASLAFADASCQYVGQNSKVDKPRRSHDSPPAGKPTGTFFTVDASFSGPTQVLEWRGVLVDGDRQTQVFRSSPYRGGSANVGEYLAIVQGLHYLIDNKLSMRLYSDSHNAQKWIGDKRHGSSAPASDALKLLLAEADRFLQSGAHVIASKGIRDWKSAIWGDIPADFFRKGRSAQRIAAADGPAL